MESNEKRRDDAVLLFMMCFNDGRPTEFVDRLDGRDLDLLQEFLDAHPEALDFPHEPSTAEPPSWLKTAAGIEVQAIGSDPTPFIAKGIIQEILGSEALLTAPHLGASGIETSVRELAKAFPGAAADLHMLIPSFKRIEQRFDEVTSVVRRLLGSEAGTVLRVCDEARNLVATEVVLEDPAQLSAVLQVTATRVGHPKDAFRSLDRWAVGRSKQIRELLAKIMAVLRAIEEDRE